MSAVDLSPNATPCLAAGDGAPMAVPSLALLGMPTEVLFQISASLNAASLGNLLIVSKAAHNAFSSSYFWKKRCEQDLPYDELTCETELAVIPSLPDVTDEEAQESTEALLWRTKFTDYQRLKRNWLYGRSKLRYQMDLEFSADLVLPKVVVDQGSVFFATSHNLTKVTPGDGRARAKVHSTRLTEAANGLRTFDVNKGRAAIASGDMWDAIHVVDADKGTVISKWRSSGERGQPINSIQFVDDRVAAGAVQCTLWDINKLSRIIRVKEDNNMRNYANSVRYFQNFFGAAWDDVAALYDVRSKAKVSTFTARFTSIRQIDINEKFVSTASSDGVLRVWDQRHLDSPLYEIGDHKRGIVQSYIDNYKAVTLAGDGRIKICDISEPAATIHCTSYKYYGDRLQAFAVSRSSLYSLGESLRVTDFDSKKRNSGFFQNLKNVLSFI